MINKINIPKIVSDNIQIRRVLSEDDKLSCALASIDQNELSRSCKVIKRRITKKYLDFPELSNTSKNYNYETAQGIKFKNIKDKFEITESKGK